MSARLARRAGCIVGRRLPFPAHQMRGWLDIDRGHDGTATGNAVSAWSDRMGTFNFVQATGSEQPTWSPYGYLGLRGIRFDGTADVITYTGSPFDGGTTAYVVLLLGGVSQTKYVWAVPDAIAGSNGLEVELQGNAMNVRVKTDTAFTTTNLAASYGSQGRLMIEVNINLANTPDIIVVTDDDLAGTTNAGTILEEDAGVMTLGAFSDGGAANFAAADVSMFLILTRPLSIGERRRTRRFARRHFGAGHTIGNWRDGAIEEVI